MRRVGIDPDLVADDLLADAISSALLREKAPPLVGLSCVSGEEHKHEQVGEGRRFENHGVLPRFDPAGFFAIAALPMAVSANAPGCSSRSSLNDFEAQPDPEPSGVRAVRL